MQENPGRALALFDFDGTMLRGDSIVPYLRLAWRLGALSLGEYARIGLTALGWAAGRVADDTLKTRALRFRRDLSPERRMALDTAFARETLLPRVYPQARECLAAHQKAGALTLLVSASTENYMAEAARALGFDGLLCTPVLPDFSVRGNCKGEEKVRRIREYLHSRGVTADFSASYAYGDSKSDLPMLRLCGHPVLVNPKRALKKAAPGMPRAYWRNTK